MSAFTDTITPGSRFAIAPEGTQAEDPAGQRYLTPGVAYRIVEHNVGGSPNLFDIEDDNGCAGTICASGRICVHLGGWGQGGRRWRFWDGEPVAGA